MTNKKIQPALIGAFIVLSFFLFTAALIIFGGKKFFDKENTVITYFEDSLQGLSVGAPVTYRGVTVGQVKAINIHVSQDNGPNHIITIPVLISLIPGSSVVTDGPDGEQETVTNKFLAAMCEQGLRAKLKTQSMLTGKLYIDLAVYENSTPVYRARDNTYFEIPTLPSERYQITQILENMDFNELYNKAISTFNSLENLAANLDQAFGSEKTIQLIDEINMTITRLHSILTLVDDKLPPILQKMEHSLGQIDELASHADQVVTSIDKRLTPFMDDMDATLKQADQLLRQAKTAIAPSSPLYFRLTETMQQLEEAAVAVQKLSNFLHRNPEALIYGLQNPGDSKHEL